jgi:hypothetical protein
MYDALARPQISQIQFSNSVVRSHDFAISPHAFLREVLLFVPPSN